MGGPPAWKEVKGMGFASGHEWSEGKKSVKPEVLRARSLAKGLSFFF